MVTMTSPTVPTVPVRRVWTRHERDALPDDGNRYELIDGVLIGAGDGRWLAVASVVQLLAYLPVVGLVLLVGRSVSGDAWGLSGAAAVTALLWIGFTGFMLVRAVLLRHRVRGDAWAVTGATR